MKTLHKESEVKTISVFDMPPGSSLSGNGLFDMKGCLNDSYEQNNKYSLFGALVQSKVTSLDVRLEIPEFTNDNFVPEIKIPQTISMGQLSEDEGFVETKSEMSSSVTSAIDSGLEDDIWEQALSHTLNRHYTWERIGCEAGLTEKPFITEAGTEAFDQFALFKICQSILLYGETEVPARIKVTEREMVRDVIYLMIGVPSKTFTFDHESDSFVFTPGVFVTGHSTESLSIFLNDFLECGSNYRRLAQFSEPLKQDSYYEAGLVFQAFTTAIRKVLKFYTATILSIDTESTLMEIKCVCTRLFSQLEFLIKVTCHRITTMSSGTEIERFPKGIELISYLYKETLEANSTDNYPMMLSILQTTCGPFTLFLQNWVFHGIYQDLYGEFTIQVNPNYLEYRDRQYWTHSFVMTTQKFEDCVPIFLSDLASDIIVCGKSLNLLKLCCPEHFMCNVTDKDIPRVTITFSEEDLIHIDIQSQMYASRMRQIARQLTLTRKEKQRRMEQARLELAEKAHKVTTTQMKQFHDILTNQKKAEDMKKRKEFQRLKEQMNEDLLRRASEEDTAKAEDKKFMDAFTNREEAMTEEEQILEEQAKEEIIAYYKELGDEAARREEKALWKVRRARLELERAKFLMDDADKWRKEMDEFKEADKVLKESDPPLPSWASQSDPSIQGSPSKDLNIDLNDEPIDAQKRNGAETDAIATDETDKTQLSSDEDTIANTQSTVDGPTEATNIDSDKKLLEDASLFESKDNTTGTPEFGKETMESSEETPDLNKSPKKTPIKTMVKMNESFSASSETQPTPEKHHIKLFDTTNVSKETTQSDTAKSVKSVDDKHVAVETEEEEVKQHIKSVADKHFSQETTQVEERPGIRTDMEKYALKESDPGNERMFPKLKEGDHKASDESKEKEWKVKPASVFGHSSQMSESYNSIIPKLKQIPTKHVSFESNFKDFAIKPRIRMNKTTHATKESDATDVGPKVRSVDLRFHPSKQSTFVDEDKIRINKFKESNIHGHASDSSVQKLLYYGLAETVEPKDLCEFKQLLPQSDWTIFPVEPYETDYDSFAQFPKVDLMGSVPFAGFGALTDNGIGQHTDVEKYKYMSLPSVLKKSMMAPLKAQISLVNKSIVDYFFVELHLEEHFETLRRYLFMEDGDFSQILSDSLLDKLATNPLPQEMLNPIFLNGVLKKSLQSSINPNDKYAENLTFCLKFIPNAFVFSAHDTLDCLELRYNVEWPINVVLTESCISKYGAVFSFMLQLKRIVWVLKDVWYRLKRDSLIKKAGNCPQFRQLQLYRQEMQHFVKVMQGYIANQIIHVTWQEFQEALTKDVRDLDDLHKVHGQYLEKAVFRCLLNKKAKPVMKIIQDIFSLILKFQNQLLNGNWRNVEGSSEMVHSNFNQVSTSYKAFRQYSVFLFEVVNKLAIRGYQPHLQELLLRLNFNNYYKDM
ncbi:hypothetical protein LOTGIDRAFT_208649 [Lottia gigantea]|uniref:Gamma-tubulin complex component 6 n=1 Tax=Lottia gigantea TaxID=225164 RepID=V4B586_LOTGI|nr:hypothetical protein LOTGIDRAFT_208649 [Lottia gigantea]ESP05683.1 hypothetical protein LOTGIDRAFT_208649 [Lottia gigantea]